VTQPFFAPKEEEKMADLSGLGAHEVELLWKRPPNRCGKEKKIGDSRARRRREGKEGGGGKGNSTNFQRKKSSFSILIRVGAGQLPGITAKGKKKAYFAQTGEKGVRKSLRIPLHRP